MNRFILASKITAKDSCVNFNKQILIDIKQEMANIKYVFARLNVIFNYFIYWKMIFNYKNSCWTLFPSS